MFDAASDDETSLDKSPVLQSQRNWQALTQGEEYREVVEYPLYSDTYFEGDRPEGLGPYEFINTIPKPTGALNVNAAIILRISYHIDAQSPDMSKTSEAAYHGGSLVDELAALSSLCVGARIRAGGESRRFRPGEDPLGRPVAWNDIPKPIVRVRSNRLVMPGVVGRRSLNKLVLLASIATLSTREYVSLIRAANLYQDALWIVESEPNLAWLMLVSALETAAGEHKSSHGSADERLRYSKPEVAELLEKAGGPDLVGQIADLIEPSLGATKKFVDFTLEFLPSEPKSRPKLDRVNWTKQSIKKTLNKVYSYRSRALHGGIPFPSPMLESPHYLQEGSPPSERPMGLAMASLGSTWLAKDVPINLHCFHYIVRGTLLNWWRAMARTSA